MAAYLDVDTYIIGSSFHQINPSLCVAVNESKERSGAPLCLASPQEKSSGEVVGAVVITFISLSLWDSPGTLFHRHELFSLTF